MKLIKSEENIRERSSLVYELAVASALSLGCWGSLFSMFGSPLAFLPSLALVILLPLVMTAVCRLPRFGRYAAFYVLLAIAVYFLLFYRQVWNGFLRFANGAVHMLNARLGTGYLDFTVSGGEETVQLWMALLPVMLIFATAAAHSVVRRQPLIGFLFTAVPVLIGILLKGSPSVFMILLLILAWTALFLTAAGSRLPVLAAALVVLAALSLLFTAADWKPLQSVNQVRDRLVQWEETLRYGGSRIESLPRGDLRQTHPLEYSDEAVFSLRMEKGQSLYLRGFAGADFKDGRWTETDERAYSGDFRGICEWMAEDEIYPWCQWNSLYRLTDDFSFSDVEIENKKASSKYIWVPYETAVTGDITADRVRFDQDRALLARGFRGQRSYKARLFDTTLKNYTDTKGDNFLRTLRRQDGYDAFLGKEKVYRHFVYETYTTVPAAERSAVRSTGIDSYRDRTLDATIYYIRQQFEKKYKYSLSTKAAPADQDPLIWFLQRNKTGNSSHFATAAVMMLREAGFPTRYAEGYYLSDSDLALYEDLHDVRIEVTDSMSHAWVEVYVDGLGWVPLEVTPGYYKLKKEVSTQTRKTEKEKQTKQHQTKRHINTSPQPDQPQGRRVLPLWVILLMAAAAAVAAAEFIGHRRLRRRRDWSDCFRYLCRLLAFDGFRRVRRDPCRRSEEIGARYDAATTLSYRAAIRLIYQVRFGETALTEEETDALNAYVRELAATIYMGCPWYRRLLMRGILFLR
ncbi:MAG: transglutaminase domain-containing protein [Anaerovoracaceae bacterium]|jgi:hypothetical protein